MAYRKPEKYAPRRGSFAARAIELIRNEGPQTGMGLGARLASSAAQRKNIRMYLAPALKDGQLFRAVIRGAHGTPCAWALTQKEADEAAARLLAHYEAMRKAREDAAIAADERDDPSDLPIRRIVRATDAPRIKVNAPRSVFELGRT